MPSINFKESFADDVRDGVKRCTIRRHRQQPLKVGDRLHMFSGMRTKSVRKLGEALISKLTPIEIRLGSIWLDGSHRLDYEESEALALRDGFDSVEAFLSFFAEVNELPFRGVLIEWDRVLDAADWNGPGVSSLREGAEL